MRVPLDDHEVQSANPPSALAQRRQSEAGILIMRRLYFLLILSGFVTACFLNPAVAQAPAASTPKAATPAKLSTKELDKLVGRIALYPDELIGIVLPASTYPLHIVQAARFLVSRKKNPKLKPRKDWDTSVLGLLNYPEVIGMMDKDLDWTWKLGEAVVNQQKDVIAAIQQFRARAHAAGNLKSNKNQKVNFEKSGAIIIKSPDPEVIYVPQYNPQIIVVKQAAPVTVVYSNPYPVYYRPAAAFYTGMFVGAAITYGVGWHNHNVHHSYHYHGQPPGRPQSWQPNRNPGTRPGARPGNRPGARPGNRPGARPGNRPGARPGNRPRAKPARRPSTKPARRPSTKPANRARTRKPANRARTQPQRSRTPQRSRQSNNAFRGYGRGVNQQRFSNRGQRSRSRMSRGRGRRR